jgi:hypothetical protein
MGTLYSQRVRHSWEINIFGEVIYSPGDLHNSDGFIYSVQAEAENMQKLAKQLKIPLSELIAIKHYMVIDRANNLINADGDIKDEQLAGLGEEMSIIGRAINTLADVERLKNSSTS